MALVKFGRDLARRTGARMTFAGMGVFALLPTPGFILAGNLMNRCGITQRISGLVNALVGWIRGGLRLINIAASMLFGGTTGTAGADAVSIAGAFGYRQMPLCAMPGSSPAARFLAAGIPALIGFAKVFVCIQVAERIQQAFGNAALSLFDTSFLAILLTNSRCCWQCQVSAVGDLAALGPDAIGSLR